MLLYKKFCSQLIPTFNYLSKTRNHMTQFDSQWLSTFPDYETIFQTLIFSDSSTVPLGSIVGKYSERTWTKSTSRSIWFSKWLVYLFHQGETTYSNRFNIIWLQIGNLQTYAFILRIYVMAGLFPTVNQRKTDLVTRVLIAPKWMTMHT